MRFPEPPRYKVVGESQSNHCCFEATVVDTHRPSHELLDPARWPHPMCECFDTADAELICRVLNEEHERVSKNR